MNHSRLELRPGVWLDARRAVWLEAARALLVADLHLGYAWAHRQSGNLLPVEAGEDTLRRLRALVEDYSPEEIIVLGDVVHAATSAEALGAALRELHELGPLRLIVGNHDTKLPALLREAALESAIVRELTRDSCLLLHGDTVDEVAAEARLSLLRKQGGLLLMGHEHPAISISDGVATGARCPCFLVGDELLVLPAFTSWSSGTNVRGSTFLSAYTRCARPGRAVAILAGRLLPVKL